MDTDKLVKPAKQGLITETQSVSTNKTAAQLVTGEDTACLAHTASSLGGVREVLSAPRCSVMTRGTDARQASKVGELVGGREHRQFARRELPSAAMDWQGHQVKCQNFAVADGG